VKVKALWRLFGLRLGALFLATDQARREKLAKYETTLRLVREAPTIGR
jgi:hypothetical protein